MKYRKLPIEVEAFQWTGGPDQTEDPEWCVELIRKGDIFFMNERTPHVFMMIKTHSGFHRVDQGDYVVKGPNDIYPVKKETFEKTFEPIQAEDDTSTSKI